MTLPPVGSRMVRLEDGQKGTVALVQHPGAPEGEPRICYWQQGAQLIAGKLERWHLEAPARAPLRAEEKLEVALHADRVLRAIDLHEPLKAWQRPRLSDEPYDAGLVLAIIGYLTGRS